MLDSVCKNHPVFVSDNCEKSLTEMRQCHIKTAIRSERLSFHVARWVTGAIAQLGEHLLCKQGVVGSIPSGSTNPQQRLCLKHKLSARSAGSCCFSPDYSIKKAEK